MSYEGTQITAARAYRLGRAPAQAKDRRRRAEYLLGTGRATLLALAAAWYGGDVDTAKAELYPPSKEARCRPT
jgi:hypothetical protein